MRESAPAPKPRRRTRPTQPNPIERDSAWSAFLVASSSSPVGRHWITRGRRRRPHAGLAAETHLRERGEGSRFALLLIPTLTRTEIAIAAVLARIHVRVSAKGCAVDACFPCKQQEKNRGSKRNAKRINGKSRRRHKKNRQ